MKNSCFRGGVNPSGRAAGERCSSDDGGTGEHELFSAHVSESGSVVFMKRIASFVGLREVGVGATVLLHVGLALGAPEAPMAAAPATAQAERTSPPASSVAATPTAPVAVPAPTTVESTQPTAAAAPTGNSPIEKLIASQPDWACEYQAHAITEKQIAIACKGGQVLTLARTATGVQLVGRRQVNGNVKDFYEHEGAAWARIVSESAESVIQGSILASGKVDAPTAPGATKAAVAEEPAGPVMGSVSRVDGREAVVDLPVGHGLKEGDRLTIARPVSGSDAFFADDPVIAKVVRVMDEQVLVRLGMNEVVETGFTAQSTNERETGSRRSPPRVYDVWDLRAVLRPVLNIGSVGGGVGGELGLARRTEHFRFGVNFAPLSYLGASGEGSVLAAGGYAFAAVDHQIYSAGVGVGGNTVNDTDGESESGSGLSIVQLLRIGAVDGLHVSSRVEAVIFRSEVLFGYLQLEGQLAVADTAWLVVRGGGGSIGYGFGEVVVRNLLWGTGQSGSTFLELGLGGAGGFEQSCPQTPSVVPSNAIPECTNTNVGGPMFTAGLEWRL